MRNRLRTVMLLGIGLLHLALGFQAGMLLERVRPLAFATAEPPRVPPYTAGPSEARDPGREPLGQAERVAGLSTIWEQARYNYPFWHRLEGLDWDGAYRQYLTRVLAAPDDLAYYRLLEEFVALLQDGHSSVQLPRSLQQQMDQPAIRLIPVGGQMVVAAASPALLQAGVAKGAILQAIDGEPAAAVVARVGARMPASTEPDRLERTARHLLEGEPLSEVSLTLALPESTTRTVTVTRDRSRSVAVPSQWEPLVTQDLGDGVFRVTIYSFATNEVVDLFNQAFPTFRGVKGLIFDLRENGGGNSSHGDAIVRRLISWPVGKNQWQTRQRSPALVAWGKGEQWYRVPRGVLWPRGLIGQYRGPIYVLTSPRTYSAAEDFVGRLRAAGRAQVVGQPTGGSTGQPLSFPLPGGGVGRVVTKWDRLPDGTEFVGVGIQPDILVEPSAADYATEQDPVLTRVLALHAARR